MTETENEAKSQLWGVGATKMHPALATISDSLAQDLPLADADLRGCAAYARALGRCGVLTEADSEALAVALEQMRSELGSGEWVPAGAEDVHTAIEAEVTRRVGDLGGRLHTGRSRNDQVATAFRLTVMGLIDELVDAARSLQEQLVARAEAEIDTLMPAYTHMQRAQPIRLAHWLLAYFWPLQRDIERLRQARRRAAVLPLGSGAVAGHPFDIDRSWLAQTLGFDRISENSLDAVGDRDFAVEFVSLCAMTATHLSRIAEELVVWSSTEFGFVRWPDDLATGSSLMPNKKNPDLVELVRGRTAQTIGEVTTMFVLLKGLPSSYQRDLQEDKPPVWRAAQWTRTGLLAMAAALEGITFERERMAAACTDDTFATELADILVDRGLPFRSAYRVVSGLSKQARERRISLKELAQDLDHKDLVPLTAQDVLGLTAEASVERRSAPGGTARVAVLEQLKKARQTLSDPA